MEIAVALFIILIVANKNIIKDILLKRGLNL